MLAVHAAQKLINRNVQRLALDVPKGQVERAQSMNLLAARRIEERSIHVLPAAFDVERIAADQSAGALFQRIARASFADAGDARIRLDRHQHVALIEEHIQIRRLVNRDFRNFRLGHAAKETRGPTSTAHEAAATDLRNVRRFIFVLPVLSWHGLLVP